MNINIAFSTIIYIMVFLFPGILFRRAFFSGDFNKQFESGNAFERILWNMLVSMIMLVMHSLSIQTYNSIFYNVIDFGLKNEDIADTFICLYENKFPTIFISEIKISSTIKLLFSIYSFSFLLGFFLNRTIFYLGFQKRFSILQFQNHWKYLTDSNKQNNISHSFGDIHYTKVDIKSPNGDLFTGKLHRIIYDKDDKIEAISIQDAYKFYKLVISDDQQKINEIKELVNDNDPNIIIHSETNINFIYRKKIKGNIFTIFNNDIENISITFIKISNFYRKLQNVIKILISLFILLISIFFLSYAIWDFQIINFSTYSRRLFFCLLTPLAFIFTLLFFISLFNRKKYLKDKIEYYNQTKDSFLLLIIFYIPYLFIFNKVNGLFTIIILFTSMIIVGKNLSTNKK